MNVDIVVFSTVGLLIVFLVILFILRKWRQKMLAKQQRLSKQQMLSKQEEANKKQCLEQDNYCSNCGARQLRDERFCQCSCEFFY